MTEYSTIILTSLATLVIAVAAGIAVEFIKRIRPKIVHSIREAIPIEIDEKMIGANVVYINNPSSKTVKDIVVKIKSLSNEIRNGGIKSTTGLDYDEHENGDTLKIEIPFLKYQDSISITTITEGKYRIPSKPDVTIRSPDSFKLITESEQKDKASIFRVPSAALVAAFVVGATLAFTNSSIFSARSDQGAVMVTAASVVGLPDLAEKFISNDGIFYYNQGPYIYSLAKSEKNATKVEKYRQFLIRTITISNRIASGSKAALCFFARKISLLQGNKADSEVWFEKARETNENELEALQQYYKDENLLTNQSS